MPEHREDHTADGEPGAGARAKAISWDKVLTDFSALKIFDSVLKKTRGRVKRP